MSQDSACAKLPAVWETTGVLGLVWQHLRALCNVDSPAPYSCSRVQLYAVDSSMRSYAALWYPQYCPVANALRLVCMAAMMS